MRCFCLGLAVLIFSFPVWGEEASPWVRELDGIHIPMRDGKWLDADIHFPPKAGKYPTILIQTPYNRKYFGAEVGERVAGRRVRKRVRGLYDREHYVYVIVDWRGFYGSKEAARGMARVTRGPDGYDVVEWIAKQPFSVWDAPRPNQPIWKFAERLTYKPRTLDVPMLFVTGWWDHFPDAILKMFADVRAGSGPMARAHSRLIVGPWTHMDVDLRKQGDLEFPDAVDVEKEEAMAFFDYWLRNVRDNGWAEAPVVKYYRVADGEGGKTGTWVDCEAWPGVEVGTSKLMLHASGRIGADPLPEATGELPYTREYRYDPRDPSPTIGGCNLPPLSNGPKDQRPLEKRPDVLVYSAEPLVKPLRVLGNMAVTLSFSVNRVDADFSVRVCDVFPDGRAIHVVDGIQRARYRSHGVERLLDPGERYVVRITLPVTAYTFATGHALKLLVSSSNYPRFEPNAHTGDPHFDEAKALDLEVKIFHDRENPTFIDIPVVR